MARPTGAQVGDTQVFRNVNALPLAYFADAAVLEADCADGEDPFTRQNRLASALIGEETGAVSAAADHRFVFGRPACRAG